MADNNLALVCDVKDAVWSRSESEQARVLRQLKTDMDMVVLAAMSLENAVNQLEEGTDVTRRCVEALIAT